MITASVCLHTFLSYFEYHCTICLLVFSQLVYFGEVYWVNRFSGSLNHSFVITIFLSKQNYYKLFRLQFYFLIQNNTLSHYYSLPYFWHLHRIFVVDLFKSRIQLTIELCISPSIFSVIGEGAGLDKDWFNFYQPFMKTYFYLIAKFKAIVMLAVVVLIT